MEKLKVILLILFISAPCFKIYSQSIFTIYDTTNTPLIVNKINCLAREGNILWAGSEYGFASYDGTNWNYYLFNNQTASYLNNIYAITIDASGNKWIGTAGGGLGKFDGNNWTVFSTTNSQLPSNIVKAITIDSHNNMWIGTTGGLAKWDMDTSWIIYQQFSSALMSDNIECITDANNDTIWIGTVNGGFTRVVDTTLTTYTIQNFSSPDNTILDFVIGLDGSRWMGCAAHGISYFQYNSPPYVQFHPGNSDMTSYTVNSLAIDTAGKLLCGTFDGGLVRYLGGIYWQVYNYSTIGLPDSSINDILIDSTGVMWLATTNSGVVRFNEPALYQSVINSEGELFSLFKIYPNPTTDYINLNISSSEINEKFKIEIFDFTGKNIIQDLIYPTGNKSEIRIDLTDFISGIYLIKISGAKNIQTGKFVKL